MRSEDVRRFLRRTDRPVGQRGDHDLNPDMPLCETYRDAAVLVPLVCRAEGVAVVLTRRAAHLAVHAGQICFPGGQVEPEDASAEDAALRETEEEIGLTRDHVEVIGRLDTYLTRTGFRIIPVVGLVHLPFELRLDAAEVEAAFEAPLAVLFAPGILQQGAHDLEDVQRFFYVFPYEQHTIWGATAGILVNLRETLTADWIG